MECSKYADTDLFYMARLVIMTQDLRESYLDMSHASCTHACVKVSRVVGTDMSATYHLR